MSTHTEVTVVIPCHDEARWSGVISAIESVHRQSHAPSEVIVAVDHNTDMANRLRREVPTVNVVLNDGPEYGAGATRNAGAKPAKSEIIAFLDDDETASPQWLAALVEPLAEPSVVGTGGRYLPDWRVGKPAWFPDIFLWVVGAHHPGMPSAPSGVRNVWSGNMAVRKSKFHEAGGFKSNFGKVGERSQPEDTEFCIRVSRLTGGRWIYVPEATIRHEVPGARSSFRYFLRRCYSEGHGKIVLRDVLDTGAETLGDEEQYIRRDIPESIVKELTGFCSSLARVASILAGVAASGTGAIVASGQMLPRRVRASSKLLTAYVSLAISLAAWGTKARRRGRARTPSTKA